MLQAMTTTHSLNGADEANVEALSIAVAQIQEVHGEPKLFNAALRPTGSVVFSAGSAVGKMTVRFTDAVPLQGVGQTFEVFPGGPVELSVKALASGSYPFTLEAEHAVLNDQELVLEVSDTGPLDKVGFACPAVGLTVLQTYLRSNESSFLCEVLNHLEESCTVLLTEPGKRYSDMVVPAHGQQSRQIPISGLGGMLLMEIVGQGSGERSMQSGGTEQFEIIIEPG